MKTKFLSLLLVLSMFLTMLAACNNDLAVDGTPDDGQQNEEIQPDDVQGEEVVEEPFDGTLKLVVDGVSDYVIVRGENAYISEVTASTELQSYLKQITGVEIPIVTDETPAVAKEIVVGKTNREAEGEFDREELGDDGLVIKSDEHKLFLVGGEQRGTLYAVYEFLEAYLGCRFYTVDFELVPETKTITLETIEEDKQIPVFDYRDAHWSVYSSENISVKRRLNSWTGGNRVSEEFGGSFRVSPWCHTFQSLISFAEYSETHPEYFAHYDDSTIIDNDPAQLCLTNETVLQMSIEKVRSWITSTPNVKVVDISQNDGGGPCMCSNCQAVYAEENGAYSGAVIRFVNAIATALKDEFPDVKFQTLAYQYTRDICVTKPAENVIVRLCSIEACKNHPFAECDVTTHKPSDSPVSKNSFAYDIRAWAEHSTTLYIWDYVTNFSSYCINFSTFETLKENMQFFADNKVKGIFEQGNGWNTGGEFDELRAYLTSKLLWDPYMSDEEYNGLIEDFMKNVYGPGWTYLKEFIDYRVNHEQAFHTSCYENYDDLQPLLYKNEIVYTRDREEFPEGVTLEMVKNLETTDWSAYDNYYSYTKKVEVIDKGYELFGKAMELAETDYQRKIIDKAMIQVMYLDSYYRNTLRSQQSGNMTMLIKNALKGLGITGQEYKDISKAATSFFNEKYSAEYAEFNKQLREKMVEHGAVHTRENGSHLGNAEPNYAKTPCEW